MNDPICEVNPTQIIGKAIIVVGIAEAQKITIQSLRQMREEKHTQEYALHVHL